APVPRPERAGPVALPTVLLLAAPSPCAPRARARVRGLGQVLRPVPAAQEEPQGARGAASPPASPGRSAPGAALRARLPRPGRRTHAARRGGAPPVRLRADDH